MGCVSSKVEQAPGNNVEEGGDGQAPEESRPAQPVHVVESVQQKTNRAAKNGRKGKNPLHQQVRQDRGARGATAGDEEVEGETLTDVSGLQMRTPRTCTDPGLHQAAKNGDLPLVHKLLSKANARSKICSEDEADQGPNETVSGTPTVDLDERGMWGNTPLHVATQYAHPQVALALIAAGASACLENERRATALHFSCAEGLLDVCRALLDNGAHVDPPVAAVHHPAVNGGQTVPVTPLSAASTGGHTELVRLLVERGAEVDRRVSPKGPNGRERRTSLSDADGVGGSALTAAARYGHTETCLFLIDNGANILLEDWGARTPLLHALLRSQVRTSLVLLDAARLKGCVEQLVEPSVPGTGVALTPGESPLNVACGNGLDNVARALLSAGAKIERRDGTGASSLLRACRKGRFECVRELLSRNADPLAADHHGDTPLSVARNRIDQPWGEEICELMEVAAGEAEARKARPTGPEIHQDSQLGEESEDDVLLVSDWDEDVDGTLLHDCHITDSLTGEPDSGFIERATMTAAKSYDIAGGGTDENSSEGEDVDVLLVGDYEADTEEEAYLFGMSLPGSDRQETTESTEVLQPPCNTEDPITESRTGEMRSTDTNMEKELEDQAQRSEALENRNDNAQLDASRRGGEEGKPLHHVSPQDLTQKLFTIQVARTSVGSAIAAATENIAVAQPVGVGG